MRASFLIAFVVIIAAGCTVTPPSVRVDSPIPVIKVESGHHHDSRHCPPGQAKKGRC